MPVYCRHSKSQEGSSSNKHNDEQIHLHFTYISDHGETWSFASKFFLEIINKSQCYYSWSNKKLKPLLETILANSTTIYTFADSGATKYFFQNKNIEKNSCNPINGIFMDNSIINPRIINEKQKTAYHFSEMEQPLLSILL